MRNISSIILLGIFGSVALFGATPVAQVIGSQSFDISGITAPARNLTPVSIGDEVDTSGGTALLQFRDGSNIMLQPNSALRLEGQSGKPVVRIVRGGASYELVPSTAIRVQNSRGETINQILEAAIPTQTATGSGSLLNTPLAAVGLANRVARVPGVVTPTSPVIGGVFAINGGALATGSTNPSIVTPSGLVLNLAPVVVNGVTTGYTVTSIVSNVTLPSGGTSQVTVTSGTLIGATVSITNTSAPQAGQNVSIQVTPQGSTTPLTPSQVSNAVQTSVTSTITASVQNGTLPAGTTQPSGNAAVSSGKFSSSAP